MYKIIIKTLYNTIELEVGDYKTPEVKEILEQPYIVSVRMTKVDNKVKTRKRTKQ